MTDPWPALYRGRFSLVWIYEVFLQRDCAAAKKKKKPLRIGHSCQSSAKVTLWFALPWHCFLHPCTTYPCHNYMPWLAATCSAHNIIILSLPARGQNNNFTMLQTYIYYIYTLCTAHDDVNNDCISYCQYSDPQAKGKSKLKELMENFEAKCKRKIEDKTPFGPEEFDQGLCITYCTWVQYCCFLTRIVCLKVYDTCYC